MTLSQGDALAFERPEDLAGWLAEHSKESRELWVRIYKAGSGQRSVTWTDCVVEAIRFGWIDGLKRPGDERSYLQRLTPRRSGSSWSARNRDHADRLMAEGRMTPAGLAHVEAARAEGRWETAYEGSAAMVIPQDFLEALAAVPKAEAFFRTPDRKNLYRSTTASRQLSGRRRGHAGRSRSSRNSLEVSASTDVTQSRTFRDHERSSEAVIRSSRSHNGFTCLHAPARIDQMWAVACGQIRLISPPITCARVVRDQR